MDPTVREVVSQGQQNQQPVPMPPDMRSMDVRQSVPAPREPVAAQVARPVEQPVAVSQVGLPPIEDETVQVAASTPAPMSATAPLEKELQAMTGGSASAPQVVQSVAGDEAMVSSGSHENAQVVPVIPQEIAQGAMPKEVSPSTPPLVIPKEVERVMEKSFDVDYSGVPEGVVSGDRQLSQAEGVDVSDNPFGITRLPLSYEVSLKEEKKRSLKDGGKWLAAKVRYFWRKINPNIDKKK